VRLKLAGLFHSPIRFEGELDKDVTDAYSYYQGGSTYQLQKKIPEQHIKTKNRKCGS